MVRLSKEITGLRVSQIEYKLALYADNVVFFLQNSIKSLASLNALLYKFGIVSVYKINEEKSMIMEFNIPEQIKQRIKQVSSADWKQEGIRYLWIYVTSELTSLVSINLIPLVNRVKNNLANWLKLRLSWFGRVAVMKMNILLKIVFLFLLQGTGS